MKNNRLYILLFVVAFIWLFTISFNNTKQNTNTNKDNVNQYTVSGFSTDFSEIVEKNKSSVVTINHDSSVSTGFIYGKKDSKIYVACTLHGVSEVNNVDVIFNNGTKLKADVIDYDAYLDLALLVCDSNFDVKPITSGNSTLLKDGEFVLSIGTCGSLDYSFSSQFGMVSKKYREVDNSITFNNETSNYILSMIQLSGEFVEGYSGSPVLNMNGEVVGMITMKDGKVTLATTINEIKIVLDKMIKEEEYHRLNIGVNGMFVNELENYEKSNLNIQLDISDGYYVSKVKFNSFAYNIGIKEGDVIMSINNSSLSNLDALLNAIYSDNDSYTFMINRNGETVTIVGLIND